MTKPILLLILILFLSLGGTLGHCEERAPVFLIEVDGIISPPIAKYIIESIDRAVEKGGQCLIIQLDTPGGLMDSMRNIVKKILTSSIPIIVYVAPSGGRAASAGVFITLAAHVAAMAPGTHIGAAHPVTLGAERKDAEKMMEKIVSDSVAYIKTIAKARGRNVDWAEKTVRESASITEEEALKLKVIDLISADVHALVNKVDGKVIRFDGVTRSLLTKGVQPRSIQMSWRYRFLEVISNLTIAYILLMLGIYGIFFELSNPGAIFPGVVGGIFLLVALYALQLLPINYAGLALIFLAIILFIAETQVASSGLLTIGGVISLLLGSLMLIETPVEYMRISLSVIVPAVLVSAGFFS
ncbi:MAG: NfeD family protein [Thermodesulfobacteriota bacterium]